MTQQTDNNTDDKLELRISRHIDAPPARIWQLIEDHMAEWWCPRPWWVEIVERDFRAGGRSVTIMHGPDGERFEDEGIYLEVIPERRIVFTDAMTCDWQPQGPFMIGILEMEPEGSGTRYSGIARHWTREAYEQHKEMGFETGWAAVADQAAELAERADFRQRIIDAPIEQVFDAIRDPQRLARWWGPNGFSSTFDTFDFRVGGDWRFTMHGADGKDYPNTNRFVEIADNRRVVIEHLSDEHHFTLTLNLSRDGERTKVGWYQRFDTIEHYREIAEFVAQMNEQNLDRLAAEVSKRPKD